MHEYPAVSELPQPEPKPHGEIPLSHLPWGMPHLLMEAPGPRAILMRPLYERQEQKRMQAEERRKQEAERKRQWAEAAKQVMHNRDKRHPSVSRPDVQACLTFDTAITVIIGNTSVQQLLHLQLLNSLFLLLLQAQAKAAEQLREIAAQAAVKPWRPQQQPLQQQIEAGQAPAGEQQQPQQQLPPTFEPPAGGDATPQQEQLQQPPPVAAAPADDTVPLEQQELQPPLPSSGESAADDNKVPSELPPIAAPQAGGDMTSVQPLIPAPPAGMNVPSEQPQLRPQLPTPTSVPPEQQPTSPLPAAVAMSPHERQGSPFFRPEAPQDEHPAASGVPRLAVAAGGLQPPMQQLGQLQLAPEPPAKTDTSSHVSQVGSRIQ